MKTIATIILFMVSLMSASAFAKLPPESMIQMQRLAAMHWQVVSMQAKSQPASQQFKSGLPTQQAKLTFTAEGGLMLSVGCNRLNSHFELALPRSIMIAPFISTKMACATTAISNAEREVPSYLTNATSFQFVNDATLRLYTKAGTVLTLKGTATPENQYQGTGVIKFIELMPESGRMKWREVKYHQNGLKKSQGEWQTSTISIQNFKPLAQHKHIVRIKEFTDSKTQRKVWVKDMEIESENLAFRKL